MQERETGVLKETRAGHHWGLGALGLMWGLGGVLYLLSSATLRLGVIALEGLSDMPAAYWIPTVLWVVFNAYAEGYRGFQQAFAPRLVARAQWVLRQPTAARTVLAPMFLMGLIDATKKRRKVSWIVLIAIVGLVNVVRALPQPTRGIIDAGVVVGLGWGIAAILVGLVGWAQGHPITADPELAP